ncbi:MAG: hypothetical protein EBZ69_02235 [Alphaproteobacteria bacterium]|nr:hypothetical protein [Alphaproteobacteria bacterium]NDC55621.1 hypothetical protein [Alphaproteobacteria bacterium]
MTLPLRPIFIAFTSTALLILSSTALQGQKAEASVPAAQTAEQSLSPACIQAVKDRFGDGHVEKQPGDGKVIQAYLVARRLVFDRIDREKSAWVPGFITFTPGTEEIEGQKLPGSWFAIVPDTDNAQATSFFIGHGNTSYVFALKAGPAKATEFLADGRPKATVPRVVEIYRPGKALYEDMFYARAEQREILKHCF